jgi:hypothetical protein
MTVPKELVLWTFPFLDKLEQDVEKMGAKASNSVRSMPQTLRYLAQVMVQDALELADKYSNNRFHQALIQNSQFQELKEDYATKKFTNYFADQRPKSDREATRELTAMVATLLKRTENKSCLPTAASRPERMQKASFFSWRMRGPQPTTWRRCSQKQRT